MCDRHICTKLRLLRHLAPSTSFRPAIAGRRKPMKSSDNLESSRKYVRLRLDADVQLTCTIRSKTGSIRWFQLPPLSLCSSQFSASWILTPQEPQRNLPQTPQ